MTTITLTLTVTEEERAALVKRFLDTAQAVNGEDDDGGVPSDPNGSKIDKFGVAWDARYHGANMTKNQDGSWRRKKNLSEQEKADADAYEAGSRNASATAAVAAGVAAPVQTAAPIQTTAPAADVPAFLQTGTFAPAPVMPMPGMPTMTPVAAPAPATVSYPELIAAFSAANGRVGEARLNAEIAGIYQRSGVTAMEQLEADPNVRIAVKAELDKLA